MIAKVDADQHRDLGSRFGVKGFPTLKWFPKGSTTPEDYSGGRGLDDFTKFISEKTGITARIAKPISYVKELDSSSFDGVVKVCFNVLTLVQETWCKRACRVLRSLVRSLRDIDK